MLWLRFERMRWRVLFYKLFKRNCIHDYWDVLGNTVHVFKKMTKFNSDRVGESLGLPSSLYLESYPEARTGVLKNRGAGGVLIWTRWASGSLRSADACTLRPSGASFTLKIIWGQCLDICDISTLLSHNVIYALTTSCHHFCLIY